MVSAGMTDIWVYSISEPQLDKFVGNIGGIDLLLLFFPSVSRPDLQMSSVADYYNIFIQPGEIAVEL